MKWKVESFKVESFKVEGYEVESDLNFFEQF